MRNLPSLAMCSYIDPRHEEANAGCSIFVWKWAPWINQSLLPQMLALAGLDLHTRVTSSRYLGIYAVSREAAEIYSPRPQPEMGHQQDGAENKAAERSWCWEWGQERSLRPGRQKWCWNARPCPWRGSEGGMVCENGPSHNSLRS